jgi:hypothetical protein
MLSTTKSEDWSRKLPSLAMSMTLLLPLCLENSHALGSGKRNIATTLSGVSDIPRNLVRPELSSFLSVFLP